MTGRPRASAAARILKVRSLASASSECRDCSLCLSMLAWAHGGGQAKKIFCSLCLCGRFQQVCEGAGRSDGSGLFARMTRHNSAWAGLGVIACNRLRG